MLSRRLCMTYFAQIVAVNSRQNAPTKYIAAPDAPTALDVSVGESKQTSQPQAAIACDAISILRSRRQIQISGIARKNARERLHARRDVFGTKITPTNRPPTMQSDTIVHGGWWPV